MELIGLDCKKIRLIQPEHLPYKNTTPGSRHDGKFYNTYQFDGIAFTVTDTDEFCDLLRTGQLQQVTLKESKETNDAGETVNRLELVNFVSKNDVLADDEFNAKRRYLNSDNYVPEKITNPEQLAGL